MRFALQKFDIDASFTHAGSATNRKYLGRPFKEVQSTIKTVPVVFLHRNPIDTAVSMYYQVNKRDLRPWSGRRIRMAIPLMLRSHIPPNEINRFVLDPVYGIQNICAYNRAWLDQLADRKDCLILTYEDMRTNPSDSFQRLLDHFGLTAPTGDELAEISTFNKMRAFEQSESQDAVLMAKNKNDPQSVKVRRGKVGGYKDELSVETAQKCEEIAREYGF